MIVIEGWECFISDGIRVAAKGPYSLYFHDELQGDLKAGVAVPQAVMLWLVRPLLAYAWDAASETHGCKGENGNPYDEEDEEEP